MYYDDDDTESKDYGYDEKPGKEYVKKLYPDGYAPHAFVDDEGEFFAAYTDSGDYIFTASADGTITDDTDNNPDDTDNNNPNNNNNNNNNPDNTNNNTYKGLRVQNSSSSDCNAGYFGLIAMGRAVLALKKKTR